MKKLLFAIMAFLLATQFVSAKKVFVEMEFHKNCIKLDDGSNKKRQPVKDENGKDLKFISLVGALNYMSLQGWELVDTKSVTKGGGSFGGTFGASSTDTEVYYIFCKEVSDETLEKIVNDSFKK